MRREGYTLVEVLISVLLVGILALVAVGNFRRDAEPRAVDRSAWRLAAALRHARAQAISESRPVHVCFNSSNGLLQTWVDRDADYVADPGESRRDEIYQHPWVRVSAAPTSGVFGADGCCDTVTRPWRFEVGLGVSTQRVFVLPTGRTLREET